MNTQGDRGRQFGVVLEGELTVERDGHELARLKPGDCAGEISLLSGANVPATATVQAVIDSIVWALSKSEFDELVNGAPIVAERLTHIALTRAAMTHHQ
jgi:CRP-like cAMP-binding protein